MRTLSLIRELGPGALSLLLLLSPCNAAADPSVDPSVEHKDCRILANPDALTGIEQICEKPATEMSTGELNNYYLSDSPYSRSVAVVIGISTFTDPLEDLPTERDPLRMRDLLFDELGYDYVLVLTEQHASKDRVTRLLQDEMRMELTEKDAFFLYWSGHGWSTRVDGGGWKGFLVFSDSVTTSWSTMLELKELEEWNAPLKARHAFYAIDACASGLIAEQSISEERPQILDQMLGTTHLVMTAGSGGQSTIAAQQPWDGSVFTFALLQGIRGSADAEHQGFPADGLASASELEDYMRKLVDQQRQLTNRTEAITPRLYELRDNNTGDFFFITAEKKRNKDGVVAGANVSFAYGRPVIPLVSAITLPQSPVQSTEEFDVDSFATSSFALWQRIVARGWHLRSPEPDEDTK